MKKSLTIACVNPPHADWSLANNMTWLMMRSHYDDVGRFADKVTWLAPPYRFNQYVDERDVLDDMGEADVYLFSSYMWNYDLCDNIARLIREEYPTAITIVGGPHIGTNDSEFLDTRKPLYDYVCEPTKPGEVFMEDFINEWFAGIFPTPQPQSISWCLASSGGRELDISGMTYSVYEQHFDYLSGAAEYAKANNMEPFMVLETTRGCPYKCVYCEWGGGTNTKIFKKPIDIVKRDIVAIRNAGYEQAYLTDANFGAFEDRDIEIFQFAWERGLYLTDISTVKAKSLTRRTRLFDRCFEIVGTGISAYANASGDRVIQGASEHATKPSSGDPMPILSASVVPTVSIQSVSEEAMDVALRSDLSVEDKIKLSEHINHKCHVEGFPLPSIELIMGMPGSTLDDFYREFDIIWNFRAWSSFRHDYIFLPDSHLRNPEYIAKYDIELVWVFTDIIDEDGNDNNNGFYRAKKNYFETIASCYSYSREDLYEMFFMNIAGNVMLRELYDMFAEQLSPGDFVRLCYRSITKLPEFQPLRDEIVDILDPASPPRSIKRLRGRLRNDVITEFVLAYKPIILTDLMVDTLA